MAEEKFARCFCRADVGKEACAGLQAPFVGGKTRLKRRAMSACPTRAPHIPQLGPRKLAWVKRRHKLLVYWGGCNPVEWQMSQGSLFPLPKALPGTPSKLFSISEATTKSDRSRRRKQPTYSPPEGRNKRFLSGYLLFNSQKNW